MAMVILVTTRLEISRLPEGGFMVGDGFDGGSFPRSMLFASTSIEEALKYVKAKLDVKPAQKGQ